MNSIHFTQTELAAAIARDVRQCVLIGSRPPAREAFESSPNPVVHVFAVDDEQPSDSPAIFVPTQFASEAKIVDLVQEELPVAGGHLVSAFV